MDGARLRVEAGEHAIVQATVKVVADNNRRLHVIALARLCPGDGGIGHARAGRSDIASPL